MPEPAEIQKEEPKPVSEENVLAGSEGESEEADAPKVDMRNILVSVFRNLGELTDNKAVSAKIQSAIRNVVKAVPGLTEDDYVTIGNNLCKKEHHDLLKAAIKGNIDPEAIEQLKVADEPAEESESSTENDSKILDNDNAGDAGKTDDGKVAEESVSETPNIDAMSNKYIADAIRRCFRNDLKEGDRLAKYVDAVINKYDNWKEYIEKNCNGGKNTAVVETKVIPKMVDNFNKKFADKPIDKSIIARRTANDTTGNKEGGDTKMVVPEGFNRGQVDFGNRAFLMDIGYFTINYDSDLIKAIVREKDAGHRMKVLKKVVASAKGTPAAKYLVQGTFANGSAKKLMAMITELAHVKGMPSIRKPLKVSVKDLQNAGDEGEVRVVPVESNYGKTEKVESSSWDDLAIGLEILTEGLFSKKKETESSVSVPVQYLSQFYDIATDASSIGKFLDKGDIADVKEKIGGEAFVTIKASGHNVRTKLVDAFLKANDGVPPFYILVPRKQPKEKLRVSDEEFAKDCKCVKTVDGPNKAFVYLIPSNIADAIFEVA